MAKRNYQNLDLTQTPDIENDVDGNVLLHLFGENSNGTETRVTLRMPKWHLPGLVASITAIAKGDASVAIRFVERIKEAVQ